MNYLQAAEIIGLLALSAFGFYAMRLLASFRTGILAKSWRHVAVGAIFLISAQFPLIAAGIGTFGGVDSVLIMLGAIMRFLGVVFLTIGLRDQCKVWRSEDKATVQRTESSKPIEI